MQLLYRNWNSATSSARWYLILVAGQIAIQQMWWWYHPPFLLLYGHGVDLRRSTVDLDSTCFNSMAGRNRPPTSVNRISPCAALVAPHIAH
jgi:hypothetical protein